LSIVVGNVTKRRQSENWPCFCIQLIVCNRTDMLYYYLVCGDVGAVRIHVAGQRFNYNFFHIFFPHLDYVLGVLLCQYFFITVYVDSLTARLPVDSTL
jgi:hypothetical protein